MFELLEDVEEHFLRDGDDGLQCLDPVFKDLLDKSNRLDEILNRDHNKGFSMSTGGDINSYYKARNELFALLYFIRENVEECLIHPRKFIRDATKYALENEDDS